MKGVRRLAIACASALVCAPALAQWAEQVIPLNPGWNAVFLEVMPEPAECAAVFAGVPVESVWAWNRKFSSIQFLQNPTELLPQQPEWLTWFPADHPQAFLTSLHRISGAQAYLIKVRDNAGPVTWRVKGRVGLPKQAWYPDSYNLAGLYVTDTGAPTFAQYFAASPAHAGQAVYTLTSAGEWERIATPGATQIMRGKAYWIKCAGASSYQGPLKVSAGGGRGVDCSDRLDAFVLRIEHSGAGTATCAVALLASDAAPVVSGVTSVAGPVALSYGRPDAAHAQFTWEALPARLEHELGSGQEWELELQVRRADMGRANAAGAIYASILEVTDGSGVRVLVPVTAKGLAAMLPGDPTPLPRPGLWVGSVLLDQVSQVRGSTTPLPTPASLRFRLIVHQDSNGTARLLQQASIMPRVQGGVTNYVIVTDAKRAADLASAMPNDGSLPGQRFSSVVLPLGAPLVLAYDQAMGTASATVMLGYDDPLNPFKHLYHPDHNNLDNYQTKLPEGVQSYDVQRAVSMQFTTNLFGSATSVSWGDTVAGGVYQESVQGLYHDALNTAGKFMLSYVSPIVQLDPAP